MKADPMAMVVDCYYYDLFVSFSILSGYHMGAKS